MSLGALPDLILSWFRNQGTEPLSAGRDAALHGQLKPGRQYEALVLDNLANGRNLVRVANQKFDMALPQQAKPGDVVRLTYVQAGARPTFALNAPAGALSQPVTVSQAAQRVDALIRYIPVIASPAASAAQSTAAATPLAAAAKTIVVNPAVLLAAASTPVGPATPVLAPASAATLLIEETVDSAQASVATNTGLNTAQGVAAESASVSHMLPMRLFQTVKESGLFYESHLGKWVRGEVGLEGIQREPQAGLAKNPGVLLDLPDLEGMPEQAARLASRQLNMLEGGPFIWQGQVWPGQDMTWQVTERDGGGRAAEDTAQKWRSQLRLTLPRLGSVIADLDIGALGLRIRLRARTPEALAEMKAAMADLSQRIRDSELNLTSLKAELADDRA